MEKYDIGKLKVTISMLSEKLINEIKEDFPDWREREIDVMCEHDVFTVYYSADLGSNIKTYPIEDYIVIT